MRQSDANTFRKRGIPLFDAEDKYITSSEAVSIPLQLQVLQAAVRLAGQHSRVQTIHGQLVDEVMKATAEDFRALDSCITDLMQHSCSLQERIKLLNAFNSPIRKLPYDILHNIFLRCSIIVFSPDKLLITSAKDLASAPLAIAHVCSTWRHAIFSSSQFWSRFCFGGFTTKPKPINLKVIERHQEQQRLREYLNDHLAFCPPPCRVHLKVLFPMHLLPAEFLRISDRWSTLEASAIPSLEFIQQLESIADKTTNPFPSLQHLGLPYAGDSIVCHAAIGHPIQAFKAASSLRSLALSGLKHNMIHIPWHHLRIVCLDTNTRDFHPVKGVVGLTRGYNATDIAEFLCRTPLLEELRVRTPATPEVEPPFPTYRRTGKPVNLQRLRVLKISGAICVPLLHDLAGTCPSLTSLEVNPPTDLQHPEMEGWLIVLEQFFAASPTLESLVLCTTKAKISPIQLQFLLEHLSSLSSLTIRAGLEHNPIPADLYAAIYQFKLLPKLRSLEVQTESVHNKVDQGMEDHIRYYLHDLRLRDGVVPIRHWSVKVHDASIKLTEPVKYNVSIELPIARATNIWEGF